MPFVLLLLSVVMFPFMVVWIVFMIFVHTITELIGRLIGRHSYPSFTDCSDTSRVTVVIPTWNGKELLDMCLPPLRAALRSGDEIIVVDNASTDGTHEHILESYPGVRVLRKEENGGFRGGCNAGLKVATSEIIIFLNNDMVVEKNFLQPLLEPFALSPQLFAVTAQIFFWDKEKRREETGLTRGEFLHGFLRPGHVIPGNREVYPILYAGGGSSAYDRRKLVALGGFDELYDPFYVEDLDLSYKAWMRDWPSVMAPASVVYHKHRGTIGAHFRRQFIETTVQRNNMLFSWRNLGYRKFLWHCAMLIPYVCQSAVRSRSGLLFLSFWKAVLRYPRVLRGRIEIVRQRRLTDDEIVFTSRNLTTFCEHYPSFSKYLPEGLTRVLMVCPYSPSPPSHGGAVRMYHLLNQLSHRCEAHVLSFTETSEEERALEEMSATLAGVHYMRREGRGYRSLFSLKPDSITEFFYPEFTRKIQEIVDKEAIQIVQYEYTQMAQYVPLIQGARPVVTEHDVSALGVARRTQRVGGLLRLKTEISLIAMFRFEKRMLQRATRVYSVTPQEGIVLRNVFRLGNVCDTVPSGANVSGINKVQKKVSSDEPILLFIGSFRHTPNVEGYLFFHQQILPYIVQEIPKVKVWVVGPGAPEEIRACANEHVQVRGFVQDIGEVYKAADIVICPILSGAGVRIKLLECMAYGIPFVSTSVGAEGLLAEAGVHYLLADQPIDFAKKVCRLVRDPGLWQSIADQGHQLVTEHYGWETLADNLVADYRKVLEEANA